MKRREFLRRTALGAGAVMLGASASAGTSGRFFDPFECVELGHTGLKFSRLMMGTGVRGGMRQSNLTRLGMERATEVLRGAYDRGIRWFDAVDSYGTHTLINSALHGLPRESYGIVSKIWCRPGALPESERPGADVVVARFLKELGTDYLDLVLLHCMTNPKWTDEFSRYMETLEQLKQKGLIRAHGVSCHSLGALTTATHESWVDSIHTRVNPYGAKMDGPPEVVLPVVRRIKAGGKGVIAMKILGEGAFGHDEVKKDASIRFALTEAQADHLLVGFESLAQIDDFVVRVRKVPSMA